MTNVVREYRLWRTLPSGEVLPAGGLHLATTPQGRYRGAAFQYERDYLGDGHLPLNTISAPLGNSAITFGGREPPAIVDELLPGRWGLSVIRRHWNAQSSHRSVDDLYAVLGVPGDLSMGAIRILPGETMEVPRAMEPGMSLQDLAQIIRMASPGSARPDAVFEDVSDLRMGARLGGARPKALVADGEEAYLAKFSGPADAFNHVRVEHAMLTLAREAGLSVPDARLVPVGGQEALLVQRFDVSPAGGRYHVLSANALLKDVRTHEDRAHPRYEDLVDLVRAHSADPGADAKQLYGQMLFNAAIHNSDDHLKNFSFMDRGDGWRLTQAYDLVPDEVFGRYHRMGWDLRPNPPRPREAGSAAATFGLSDAEGRAIVEQICFALERAEELLEASGVSERDMRLLKPILSWGRGGGQATRARPLSR